MAVVTPVLQITGYQDSGKTTLLTSIISYLKANGITSAVLKHHGHGGKPTLPQGKDSDKHFEAGASVAMVEGDGVINMTADMEKWNLQKLVQLMDFFSPDVILIEGYKFESFPKIVIIRKPEDATLLSKLDNIVAIVLWPEMEESVQRSQLSVPVFPLGKGQLEEWILSHFLSNKN